MKHIATGRLCLGDLLSNGGQQEHQIVSQFGLREPESLAVRECRSHSGNTRVRLLQTLKQTLNECVDPRPPSRLALTAHHDRQIMSLATHDREPTRSPAKQPGRSAQSLSFSRILAVVS